MRSVPLDNTAMKQSTHREQGNFFYQRGIILDGEEKRAIVNQAVRVFEARKSLASVEGDADEWLSCIRSIEVASAHLATEVNRMDPLQF